MRKTSLNELRRIIAELNSIKCAYDIDLKVARDAIKWAESLNKKFAL